MYTIVQIFVTSDVEDEDPDGVVDYKVGEPHNHRLLEALAEVSLLKHSS